MTASPSHYNNLHGYHAAAARHAARIAELLITIRDAQEELAKARRSLVNNQELITKYYLEQKE